MLLLIKRFITSIKLDANSECFSDRNVFPKGCIKKMEKVLL